MKSTCNILIVLTAILFINLNTYSQIINNNTTIKVFEYAYVVGINTDFVNKGDGLVENDGIIRLDGGDWINYANNNVFYNYNQKGEVQLTGKSQQIIKGSNRTIFETLALTNGTKKLEINDSEVKDRLFLNNNAVLKLNLNKFIVDNSQPESVTAQNNSYILSENIDYKYEGESHNDKVYGELQWNIGDKTGTYNVPFGTVEAEDINLTVKLYAPGQPATGNLIFATYPTNMLNYPLPFMVNSLNELRPDDVVDRYWKIHSTYTSKPSVDIKFKFSDKDISQESNPGLTADKLLAIRYNSNSNTWLDMPAKGTSDASTKIVDVNGVGANDFFDWWTLTVKSKLETTNFFTPNKDGYNDLFIPDFAMNADGKTKDNTINPVQGIIKLEGKIFNRWGNLLYEWKGDDWWDGTYKGNDVPEGTYFYVITATGSDGVSYNKTGSVGLLRKKF